MKFDNSGSGLTLTYAADVGYSNAVVPPTDFGQCTYTPTAGYDPNVRHICFAPQGTFVTGDPDPSFAVSFRMRIK